MDSNYRIFLSEFPFIFVIPFVFILGILYSVFEFFVQTSQSPFFKIFIGNMIYAVSIFIFLLTTNFIFGWRSRYFGGELTSLLFCLIVFGGGYYFLKKAICQYIGLVLPHHNIVFYLPTVLTVYLPVALLVGYIFAMASAFSK